VPVKVVDAGILKEKERKAATEGLVREIWHVLGEWRDYAWDSPGEDFLALKRSVPVKVVDAGILKEKVAVGTSVEEVLETTP